MANLPNPRSYDTLLGDMIATYMSKIGVNDLNEGSAVLSFFETMAQAIYRASGDTFSILRDYSVDRATGEALKRLAEEERVPPIPARPATGRVTISDTTFDKIETKIYAGGTPPNVGSNSVKASDASEFTSTGNIYIGRGTPNIEGPLAYSSITVVGSYYQINLTSPTTKYHNLSESIILAQGGTRNIPVGQVVKTTGSGSSPVISFNITQAAIILDGEDEVTNVPVAAQEPDTDGNVPTNSIKEFLSDPFTGASVTNPSPFTTGRNKETDDEIRARVKKARISRGLGTSIAIKNATKGAQASDENTIVTSNEIFSDGNETSLYIDNGEGYEEKTEGIGLEYIVDSALGGETHFQLSLAGSQTSVAKAFLESSLGAPYDISGNDRLAILVGDILSEHVFASSDFRSEGFATAYEISASINSDSDIDFTAQTKNNGTGVIFVAKEETYEYLQVTTPTTGTDAAIALGLPSNEVQTLRLYKNRQAINKNGRSAQIESANQNDWSATITTGDTLKVTVDGTQEITYTFTDADFISEGTYSTVSKSNSLASWVAVINAKIIGVSASINGTRLVITSNLGANSRADLSINVTSTLVAKGMFPSANGLTASGDEADFTLSRNTGQLKLTNALEVGDSLTAGTEFTRGSITSTSILGGTVTLSNDAYLWFIADNQDAATVNHGVIADSIFHFTKEGSDTVRFRSATTNAFVNISVGDYVVMWSEELNVNNRLEGRVFAVGTAINPSDYFELRLTPAEYALTVVQNTVTFSEGLAFVRSEAPPQKVKVAAGNYNINTIASSLTEDLYGITVTVEGDEYLIFTTDTLSTSGSVYLMTFDDSAKAFNLTAASVGNSITSHYAFYENENSDTDFPLFVHSYINDNKYADTPNATISSFISGLNLDTFGIDYNVMVKFKNPYLYSGSQIQDFQADSEQVQVSSLSGTTVNINESQLLRRLRTNDRYYIASPYDFSYNDQIIAILDNSPSTKTFPIPLYRRATTNNTMPVNSTGFRAYDVDSGATETFDTFFGTDYNFSNYKVFMNARNVIDPASATNEDAILYRAAVWGRAGELYNIAYEYPTSASQAITHTVTVEATLKIRIFLKSDAVVANNIDGTTEWDVTITPNVPVVGMEQVTYTWNTVGTNPAMATLAAGHYVTINANGGFDSTNIGTFRISSATATSFTVRRPSGSGTAENNIATLETNTISLYENNSTTAAEIVAYVTSNLSDYVTSELVDDNGLTGAGILGLSTYEDGSFAVATDLVTLVDGVNYILSSDVDVAAPTANFVFKTALTLPNYNTNTVNAYAFNDGEEVRLIPTTAKHVDEFLSTLAVTGLTTLGEIEASSKRTKVQISTQILGGGGAVQISGGSGNNAEAQVLFSSSPIVDTDYMKTTISRSSAAGLHANQWLYLESTNAQKKQTGISLITSVTVVPNDPSAGQSRITLGNKEDQDRYFGQPRNHIRDVARAFHVEKHSSLVCITWDGITSTSPVFNKTVDIDDGASNIVVDFDSSTGYTSYNSSALNFSEVQIDDTIVIQNLIDSVNNGTFRVINVSDDGTTVVTDNDSGLDAIAEAAIAGDIVITTEIQEGDSVVIGDPFSILNQGTFRVIRRYNDSIYIDNSAAVEERVVVSANNRSLGFDGTTSFDVTMNGDMRISWNTTGTEPTLINAKMGDVLTVGTDFAAANRGEYMVTKSVIGLNETFSITCSPAANITGGQYFTIDLPNSGTGYYVWYKKDGAGADPAPGGRTGALVNVITGNDESAVALATQLIIDGIAGFTATVSGPTITVVCDNFGDAVDAVNVDVGGAISITISQQGRLPYIECANAGGTAESGVTIADVLTCHAPSMLFSPYDNTQINDEIVISGDVLSSNNVGSFTVVEILNKTEVVVDSIMTAVASTVLANSSDQVYVQEGTAYTGYKKIHTMMVDPSNVNRYILLFDTYNQVSKINSVGDTLITAMSKLGFSTTLIRGLDSYRYNTGLIAEVNKIVYGDPRDSITYPGVSAAGAEIFIKPPLVRRIEIAINVRVNTGIPFSKITEQVRNNIAALINSSPIGVSIAISDIISSVNSIPGTKAISITSPSYSATNDVITINPAEKPFILDIINDISVSKVE